MLRTRLSISFLSLFLFLLSEKAESQNQKSWQWIRQIGGRSWDISSGMVCNSKNHVYLSGSFYSSILADSKKVDSKGGQDAFIAKFTQKGLDELISFGGAGMDLATSICMVPDNKIAVSGIISDSVALGKFKISGKGKKLYVVKCDEDLIPLWFTCLNFSGQASITNSSADRQGNIYVTGFFTEKIDAGGNEIVSIGKKDIFFAIFNQQGSIKKLYSFGSAEDDFPTAFAIDNSQNMIVAGSIGKAEEIKEIKYSPVRKGYKTNAFIACFDIDFSLKWIKAVYGSDYCDISSLKFSNTGDVFATGTFNSNLILPDTVFISKGYTDGFVLRMKVDGESIWKRSFGSWYYDYSKQVNIDNMGGVIVSGSIGDELVIDSLMINPELKSNSSLFLQFDINGTAIWADCLTGLGNISGTCSALDKSGNLYFSGYFKDSFQKGISSYVSVGDQDIFLMKYANCYDENSGISGELTFCPGSTTNLKVKHNYSDVIWNDTIKGKYNLEVGKSGKYWIRAIDEKGCIISDTVKITESKLPVFSIGKDTTISRTDSIILKAPPSYSFYQWQDLSIEPEFTIKSNDGSLNDKIAWLMVKDSLECSFTDSITIHFIPSVEKLSPEDFKINIYPNPAHDQIVWSFNSKGEVIHNFTLEIISDKGVNLKHEQIKDYILGDERELKISALLPGAYYLRISDSSKNRELKSIRFLKY